MLVNSNSLPHQQNNPAFAAKVTVSKSILKLPPEYRKPILDQAERLKKAFPDNWRIKIKHINVNPDPRDGNFVYKALSVKFKAPKQNEGFFKRLLTPWTEFSLNLYKAFENMNSTVTLPEHINLTAPLKIRSGAYPKPVLVVGNRGIDGEKLLTDKARLAKINSPSSPKKDISAKEDTSVKKEQTSVQNKEQSEEKPTYRRRGHLWIVK